MTVEDKMNSRMTKQDMLDEALALLKELRDHVYAKASDDDPKLLEILARVDAFTEDY